ncbi:MAG TPA: MYXO-CTERM sorting domain-containing protein [Pseudomonadota bacterium]|nr:MYXO-CTERM sorting domain-containing protein [Pseudomonadota bacterium]
MLPPVTATMLSVQGSAQTTDDQLRLLGDLVPANNSVNTTVAVTGPDLALMVTSAPQAIDGSVTHQLQVVNNGPGTAPGESLVYDLMAGAQIKLVFPGMGWDCATSTNPGGGPRVTCTRNSILPPATLAPPVQIVVQPPLGSATLQGRALIDVNPTNNRVDSSVPVVSGPDLALKVTENKDSIDTSIKYTLQVTNLGEGPAPGAKVVYQIPPGATVVTVEPGAGWTCTTAPSETEQGTVTCLWNSTLPVGDATPIVITVRPPAGATSLPVQAFTDGVDAQGGVLFDPDRSNNSVSESSTVDPVRFSGGGCGCKMPGTTPVPDVALTGLFLVAAAGLLRRRRRPDEQTI